MPMADIKGPSFVRRSPASSRRSTLRSSSDPTPPKGSWCCPNAGWWKEPWRGSGDAAGWPRTGNVSTTRRAHSCSSPRSASWSEGYAAPNHVSGQTLRDRMSHDVFGHSELVAVALWVFAIVSERTRLVALASLSVVLSGLLFFPNLHTIHNYYQTALAMFAIVPCALGVAALVGD